VYFAEGLLSGGAGVGFAAADGAFIAGHRHAIALEFLSLGRRRPIRHQQSYLSRSVNTLHNGGAFMLPPPLCRQNISRMSGVA
jgi:hypothetical protein